MRIGARKITLPPMLFLFPYFKPGYFETIAWLDLTYNLLRMAMLFAALVMFVKKGRLSRTFLALAALQLWLLFTTAMNASLYTYLKNLFQVAVYLIVALNADRIQQIIRGCFLLGEAFTYINILTICLFPNGIYEKTFIGSSACWFLGQKNEAFYFYIVFVIMAILYDICIRNSIRTKILQIVIYCSLALTGATNATISFTLFYLNLFALYLLKKKDAGHSTMWSLILISMNLFFFISLSIFQTNVYIKTFLVEVLQKNVTFSGRTLIWAKAFELLARRSFLGYGIMSMEQMVRLFGISFAVSAHNNMLHYLIAGGIPALALHLLFWFLCLKALNGENGLVPRILFIAWFSLSIFSLFEVQYNPVIFILYALSAKVKTVNSARFGSREKKLLRRFLSNGAFPGKRLSWKEV